MSVSEAQRKSGDPEFPWRQRTLWARPGAPSPYTEWTLRTPPSLASDPHLFLENRLRSKHQCPWGLDRGREKGIRTSSSPGVPTACGSPYLTVQNLPGLDPIYLLSSVLPNLPKPGFKATFIRTPPRPPSSSEVSLLQTFVTYILWQLSCLHPACFV